MLAPIDFIKEKYIKPNGLTQDFLCDALKIGKKTISELYQHKRGFTIHTAKKFGKFFGLKPEFILMKQLEYDLSQDNKSYDDIKEFKELSLEQKKQNISKWLLSTINNSISDKNEHYNSKDLIKIFKNLDTSKKYHYAISVIFKEVDYSDVLEYCKTFDIPRENLKKLYGFYKNELNSEKAESYEWLFE